MISRIYSSTIIGLEALPIEIEVDIGGGLPNFIIVGLPDKSVEESKERVKSAIKNSNANFPSRRIIVNLAPANLKKEGSLFDLPIAVSILSCSGQIKTNKDDLFIGELALDGSLRKVSGILPIVIMAKERGFKRLFLPFENAKEASVVKEVDIYPLKNIEELILGLRGDISLSLEKPFKSEEIDFNQEEYLEGVDFSYISGQENAKRALEIAAAGGHNILMVGPPGTGKTLLAKAFTTILPKMNFEEILEVSKIYSVSGFLDRKNPLFFQRPFRNPHHTSSHIALVGGGQWPKPGEISLSHRGVLFLDEFSEFPKTAIEVLRQPLEDGKVTISRASGSLTYPSSFTLVAASNPCPCGYYGDDVRDCSCSATQVLNYSKKISGPLLDRIDLYIKVPRLDYDKLRNRTKNELSSGIRKRVEKARDIQAKRFNVKKTKINSEMNIKDIDNFCTIDKDTEELLRNAVNKMALSGRSFHKILKVARTIADLELRENILLTDVAEALQYRQTH